MLPVRLPPFPIEYGAFLHSRLCLRSSLHLILDLGQTEHPAIRGLVRARFCEIVERRAGGLNDVPGDERSAFGRALFGALDAAFPFKHGPAVKIVLRELRENAGEVDLAVARRAKAPGAIDPGLVAAVYALASCGMKLRVFDVKHLDALVIKIEVLEIIELLQNEMTGIKKDVAARMIADALEKHFKCRAVMQHFLRVNLETEVDSSLIERVQDGLPASGQFIERGFD